MPPSRPTLSTWMLWPSLTAMSSEVSGANGSTRASSGTFHLRRAAREIAIDEAVVIAGGFFGRDLEDPFMMRRQRAGRVGIASVTRQRKGLTAAATEIDFAELATLAGFGHPAGTAIAVEGFRVLPDPGDRVIGAHGQEFEPGDAFGGMARQDFARGRDVEELPSPAAHGLLRPQRVIVGHDVVNRENALQPRLCFLDNAARLLDLLYRRHQRGA